MTESDLPARAGDVITFTPGCASGRDPVPVYRLVVPSLSARAAYERDLIARGAVFPNFAQSSATLRQAIADTWPAGPDRETALNVVSDFELVVTERRTGEDFVQAFAAFNKLEGQIIGRNTIYAAVAAQARFYHALSQIVLVQHLLVGWNKAVGPQDSFERTEGVTHERSLQLIPADEYQELVVRASSLMQLTQAQSKKSAPPVSSSSNPGTAQAAQTTSSSAPTTGP